MTNRAERRARRASAARHPVRRRSSVPALLVLVAVFALLLLAVASFVVTGAPAPTPTP